MTKPKAKAPPAPAEVNEATVAPKRSHKKKAAAPVAQEHVEACQEAVKQFKARHTKIEDLPEPSVSPSSSDVSNASTQTAPAEGTWNLVLSVTETHAAGKGKGIPKTRTITFATVFDDEVRGHNGALFNSTDVLPALLADARESLGAGKYIAEANLIASFGGYSWTWNTDVVEEGMNWKAHFDAIKKDLVLP